MNGFPDNRELRARCTLSVMNAGQNGSFFSGDYSATGAVRPAENTEVANSSFDTVYNIKGANYKKYSSRLKNLNSLSNAKIPEVNSAPSASSATFAFGGIVPGEAHPTFNKLVGPSYAVNFLEEPKKNTINEPQENYVSKIYNTPKIPFKGTDGKQLTTYNVWTIEGSSQAVKYYGPKATGNSPSIRTVQETELGPCVEVSSKNADTLVKRLFPISKDAVYDQQATIINPNNSSQIINATGANGNCSFHVNLSFSDLSNDKASVVLRFGPPSPNYNYINTFEVELKINKKPILRFLDPAVGSIVDYQELVAAVIDSNTTSYDIFVHFVGPIMLLGFNADPAQWNTIVPFGDSNTGSSGKEILCPPDTGISLYVSNAVIKFRYSALIFNNFVNDTQSSATFSNYVVASLTATGNNNLNVPFIFQYFLNSGHRFSQNGGIGFNNNHPQDKNVSFYSDLRIPQNIAPFTYIGHQDKEVNTKKYYIIPIYWNTTIEGPAFLQIETPHPSAQRAAGSFDLGAGGGYGGFTGSISGLPLPLAGLLQPIPANLGGDITEFLQSWTVTCSTQNSNKSRIRKNANVVLVNIDQNTLGKSIIDLIENNLIIINLSAGYGNELHTYFQGFITRTQYTRTGSQSTLTLSCEDIASYTLDNIYFEQNMLIAGMRHDLALDALITCAGFWDYYQRNNTNINGIGLRLNSNSVNNQELIKINITDKIGDKLNTLLERLNDPAGLPVFRWAEDYGFVLESRSNNDDTDFKFTGFDIDGYTLTSNSNLSSNDANLSYVPDWHGLLSNQFSTTTDMKTLSAGVKTFGSAITGFLAAEAYSPFDTYIDGFISQVPDINNGRTHYIGFRKYLVASLQKFVVPDYEVLQWLHTNYVKLAKQPVSTINFECYVTRPLNFHGRFKIEILNSNNSDYTDWYIYDNLTYNFNKGDNLITADISGANIPILMKDLE